MDSLKGRSRISSPIQRVSTITSPLGGQRAEPFANLSNTFQRSFISTSKGKNNGRNSSAQKSKIKALPNYEKYSMGNNLPFVTVFQTIQIERLSEEVETQRIRLKEYQRQIFNAENFEVQIKQLSEKCTGFEDEIGQYREELDKMNKICETLYHENETLKSKLKNTDETAKAKREEETKKNADLLGQIEKWKKKYSNSEKEKQKEFEQMKSIMEKQRKSMLEREIKDMQVRHQNQKSNLSMEIRRLNQLLIIKEKDNEQLKDQLQKGKQNLKRLRDYQRILAQEESRVALLSQQNMRLNQVINSHQNELEKMHNKEVELAQQLQQNREKLADYMHLKEIAKTKELELEQCREAEVQLEKEVNRNRQLSLYNEELQSKTQSALAQNQKLGRLLKERSNEIQKWKKISLELEGKSDRCRELQDEVIDLESKINSYKAENQRLKSLYKAKNDELEEIGRKYTTVRGDSDQLARFQKQRKNIEEKYRVQVTRNQELNSVVEQLRKQTGESRNLSHKVIQTEKIKQFYLRQNDKLKTKLKQISEELEGVRSWQQQYMRQSTKMKETDQSMQRYEGKIALLTEDINRLNSLLKDKNEEIVRLEDEKISNYSTLTQYKNIEQEIEDKDLTIQKVKAELDKCYAQIYSHENKIEELTHANQELMENSRNGNIAANELKSRTKQYEDLKAKYSKLQQDLGEINQLQKICQKQQNRITVYLKDIEELKGYIKECEDTVEGLKLKERQLRSENIKLKSKAADKPVSSSGSSDRVMQNSTISSKGLEGSRLSQEKLVTKINKLQYTIRELKQKYNLLLKMTEQECNIGSSQKLSRLSISKASSSSSAVAV